MKAVINRRGQMVVPKAIRDGLELEGGEVLEVDEWDGVIELRVAAIEARIVETPEGPVAEPFGEAPGLTDELVRGVLQHVRR
jgi:AbrB family looped-hinge helix DNA binding protein